MKLAGTEFDLLKGFVSMRTRRKFSAYLVMGPDGKTTFEFEPRAEGAKGKKPFAKKDPDAPAPPAVKNGGIIATKVVKARKRSPKKKPE